MKLLPVTGCVFITAILFWVLIPEPLFDDPRATVVYATDGELLGARISADDQWRFPGSDSLPGKYRHALLAYEDRFFHLHPGINIPSMARAVWQNIRAGKVVSGGSTITMQVMRMSRDQKRRTVIQKAIESLMAVRYELTATKEEILLTYASNAPFGGNVVGLEAASWRYFGTGPFNLSWAESALLAVLPNAPSLIHPGRNRDLLCEKRNRLLEKLKERGILDSLTCSLAMDEPLPENPVPLPDLSPHLTEHLASAGAGMSHSTTIRPGIQKRANEVVSIHSRRLAGNQVHNLSCLMVEVESGQVLAYVGNTPCSGEPLHQNRVDVVRAHRSTGSILKPILMAGMLDQGLLLQSSLIPDVPVHYDGYAPKNFSRGYEGAVPAYQALERSLNVPSVIMLKRYGVEPFLRLLKNLGFTTFIHSHAHYGLPLILGGAETSLWELAGVYSSLARILNRYNNNGGMYDRSDLRMPFAVTQPSCAAGKTSGEFSPQGVLDAAAIYLTFEAMVKVSRPDALASWDLMNSSSSVAWKTGTSYGFRDAWAIGCTPEYVVAVWAGNADGEGRAGLTGLSAAAPVMFDLFDLLPGTSWFDMPRDAFADARVCRSSGYLAGPHCELKDTLKICKAGMNSRVCPYHRLVHLNRDQNYRVHGSCTELSAITTRPWFVLPPLMEWYYRRKDPSYKQLPPVMPGCGKTGLPDLELVYPRNGGMVVIPVELDGNPGRIVLEAAHRTEEMELFWHVDDRYIGSTSGLHQLAVNVKPGSHRLTVVDRRGQSASVKFRVLDQR